jgi:FkbM family methyltransferase
MKVFIDLGAHMGEAIAKFKASKLWSPEWVVHAFEPNPNVKVMYGKSVILHKAAAWIEDGIIDLYVNLDNLTDEGTTVVKEKKIENRKTTSVPCINFGRWIMDNFSPDDTIVVQMDIEGAEYRVLPAMIADGSIDYLDVLYLEDHSDRIGVSQADRDNLMKSVSERTILHGEYMDYLEDDLAKCSS